MSERPEDRQIAVLGIGCRYPGADSPDRLWELLCGRGDATGDVPPDRFDAAALHSTEPTPGRVLSRRAGFIPGAAEFDADFFGIGAEEAAALDPQQRLLMMTTWEALEDAGIPPERLAGTRTGVFVGHMHSDYAERQYRRGLAALHVGVVKNYRSLLSGRLSHTFDLRGPSVSLDTACSSSLVAVHLACLSLRAGESGVAIAGGVNLKLLPDEDVLFSQARMIARDGRSKFGDASADGFCPSDGVGVVVLKRLDRALADGDRVRAVIVGSAVTNDGASGGAVLRPSAEGQLQTLRWAYEDAGVDPADVDFVEAHGTGTPLIDPLEFAAFGEVFGPGRAADRPLVVGSVKTNVGHAEGASGIAALAKVVLSMEHGVVPPNLHYRDPNPKIPWDRLPVVVPTEPHPLPDRGRPVVAGISGQGLSAVNAHVVVRQAVERPSVDRTPDGFEVFAMSARDEAALADLGRAYVRWLTATDERVKHSLRDICYSAAVRRQHHVHRFAVAVASREALLDALRSFVANEPAAGQGSADEPPPELAALVERYRAGDAVAWTDVFPGDTRFVPVPTYPWQTTRYWLD